MDFSLVLDEEGIAHELRSTGEDRWALMVDEADLVRAQAALTAFERENPLPIPRVQAPRPPTPAVARPGMRSSEGCFSVCSLTRSVPVSPPFWWCWQAAPVRSRPRSCCAVTSSPWARPRRCSARWAFSRP